jgi:ATP-dependent helicase HepA
VALLRDKRLPSGSLVLEAVFRVSVSAPARLQAKRWFPVTTLRAVVDTQKRSLARSLAASFIDERCEALDKAQVRSVVTEWRVVIEQLQQLCLKTAMQQLPALVADRTQHMLDDLATETARLRALQQVNTQVADAEITYLEQQQAQLSACYASASLQLSALRLLVVA